MKKWQIPALFMTLFCLFPLKSIAKDSSYGIVNFSACMTESKYGQQEQKAFNKLREQMNSLITDIEKQLNEIATKFQDPDFVDRLSPEAEQEMKARFQSLNEELNHTQNQYLQIMQEKNMEVMRTMDHHVLNASEIVAKKRDLLLVLRKEACFFYKPSLDITSPVIEEMNKNYDKENHSASSNSSTN